MNTLLEYLDDRIKLSDSELMSFDELAEWPDDEVKDAIDRGKLFQVGDADGIICRQCSEGCWKEVEIKVKDGRPVSIIRCEDEDCAGIIPVEAKRLWQYKIISEKKPSRKVAIRKPKELLNVRVANIIIRHQNAKSAEIAKLVDSTEGSVRTTPAWTMRKQLRNRYDTVKGWKNAEGSMDADATYEIKPEHYDIYEMFQKYKSGENPDYPNIERIAEKLDVKPDIAKDLLKEAKSILDFEADKID